MLDTQKILSLFNNNHFSSLLIFFIALIGTTLGLHIWKVKHKKLKDKTIFFSSVCYSIIKKIQIPLVILILIYGSYITLELISYLFHFSLTIAYLKLMTYLLTIGEYITYFWLALTIYHTFNTHLLVWLVQTNRNALFVIISTLSKSLYAAIALLMLSALIPFLGITGIEQVLLQNITKLFLIGVIGWIFIQIVNGTEKLIIQYIDIANNSGIKVRAINTQVILLKKIAQIIIITVSIAAGLMCFDSVKSLGAGLLTTAGVLGAIGAFASQQSLSRLFTGLQLAFSQPIKIGDTVIIENENGIIEEITFSYVVVKLWDLRRLILPTDYFFSKGLQNLTRNSTELLGTIFIYADYTLPIDIIREKFLEYVRNSEMWNKNIATFQVTDCKEHTLELRGLISANDSPTLWNLRCEIREKLINYIVSTYPSSLPTTRNINFELVKNEQS